LKLSQDVLYYKINRGLTAIFIIVFALAVAFFIFYRLGLFTRFFPNSKIAFSGILSSGTTTPTPTALPTQKPESTPRATIAPPANATPTTRPTQNTWITPLPTRTTRPSSIPVTNIPNTGSPTAFLPLLGSLGALGLVLRKKTK